MKQGAIALLYSAIVFMKVQHAAYPHRRLLHQIRTSLHNNKKPSEKSKGTYLYLRIKRHAKMVIIGLHTTINSDRTNELLAAPTDRRDTKYY